MYSVDEVNYECPFEALSNILGKKWMAAIIWNINNKKIRFGELQRNIDGCSKKMLIQQLDILVKNNIVINDKKIVNNVVESTYYLTNSGISLLSVMESMIIWSNENLLCKDN